MRKELRRIRKNYRIGAQYSWDALIETVAVMRQHLSREPALIKSFSE